MFTFKSLVGFFLLLETLTASLEISRLTFYKTSGKKLNSKPIKQVIGVSFDHCMSLCMDYDNCKSFNVHHGSPPTQSQCSFFADDVCSSGQNLINDPLFDYFDTNGGKCEKGESLVELSIGLLDFCN